MALDKKAEAISIAKKLKKMRQEGKEDTEEYMELDSELFELVQEIENEAS